MQGIDREAIFSDGTESFRSPTEPRQYSDVILKCRVAHQNVDSVTLIADGMEYNMTDFYCEGLFDIYQKRFMLTDKTVKYYFKITQAESTVFYNRAGVSDVHLDYGDFKIIPGFYTPDWAKGAVMYQIFTDRFCNGDIHNDVLDNEYCYIGEPVAKVRDWNKYPDAMDVREFYGGDLKGVIDKLDYLKDLGVEVIYFNPLFVSPSNHKYDIQDYDYIDPHFGEIVYDEGSVLAEGETDNSKASRYISRVTDKRNLEAGNRLFCRLVSCAHDRGMRVILDGVFNHCGSYNKWLDRELLYEKSSDYEKGAYVDSDSPYHSFFKFSGQDWPYNKSYDGWWNHETLPKLNYEESPELFNDIMRVAAKWVSPPYNADGWRLDVAADLGYSEAYNHKFWKAFRNSVKSANPNAVILAEHYGNPAPWLSGEEWDTIMNYDAFMEPVSWFLTGMEKHSDRYNGELRGNSSAFFESMKQGMFNMTTSSLYASMNELSNHDHSRFLTRTNGVVGRTADKGPQAAGEGVNKAIMRAAVIIQMTWPGAPTVYYGDEAGLCGWTDPDNRRGYPWGREDKEMIQFHKEMIRIHRDYTVLKTGSLIFLGAIQNVICYGRFDSKCSFVIAVNCGGDAQCINVPVWKLGIDDTTSMVTMMKSEEEGYSLNADFYHLNNGYMEVCLEKFSAKVIKSMKF